MGVGAPHPHGPAGVGWTGVRAFLGGAPVVGPSIKSDCKRLCCLPHCPYASGPGNCMPHLLSIAPHVWLCDATVVRRVVRLLWWTISIGIARHSLFCHACLADTRALPTHIHTCIVIYNTHIARVLRLMLFGSAIIVMRVAGQVTWRHATKFAQQAAPAVVMSNPVYFLPHTMWQTHTSTRQFEFAWVLVVAGARIDVADHNLHTFGVVWSRSSTRGRHHSGICGVEHDASTRFDVF
jgi:hypothetical protein